MRSATGAQPRVYLWHEQSHRHTTRRSSVKNACRQSERCRARHERRALLTRIGSSGRSIDPLSCQKPSALSAGRRTKRILNSTWRRQLGAPDISGAARCARAPQNRPLSSFFAGPEHDSLTLAPAASEPGSSVGIACRRPRADERPQPVVRQLFDQAPEQVSARSRGQEDERCLSGRVGRLRPKV